MKRLPAPDWVEDILTRAVDAGNLLRFGRHCPRKFQLLYCAPKAIRQRVLLYRKRRKPAAPAPPQRALHGRFGRLQVIRAGDWDREGFDWTDHTVFRAAGQRIHDGVPWSATGDYRRLLRILAERGEYEGCRTQADIDRRLAGWDAMIDEIRRSGRMRPRSALNPGNFRERGGIEVAIGRDGDILFAGSGYHRLSVAWHLDLPAIPVCVVLVHREAVISGRFRALAEKSARLQAPHGPA